MSINSAGVLPSRTTIANNLEGAMEKARDQIRQKCVTLKQSGGGITMDFTPKDVDYLAVTVRKISDVST